MKKFLSLALTFAVSSLSLISMLAQPVRAQQVASAGKSISEIKEEYERLLAVDRDPSTPSDVKEINHQFLEKRRTQLRAAIEARLGGLRKYQASMGTSLSGEESIVIVNSISALERDLSALAGAQNTVVAPRARLIGATPSASQRAATRASSQPSQDAQSDPAVQVSYSGDAKPNREPESGADVVAPRKARALEVTSPDRDKTVHVGEVEMEIGVFDEDIDDIMVAVYTPASEKPKSARILNIKRSDKGLKSVVVSLSKGDNRIEISDLKRSDIKAERNITYTTAEAPGIGSTARLAAAAAENPAPTPSPTPFVQYDWGRVRAYFTGGMIFSKEREDFSKSDIAFGFVLDKNYVKSKAWNLNTFFEARLTAVPVAAAPTPDPDAEDGEDTNQFDAFITSKKAGFVQVGVYAPVNVTAWKNQRELNTLFIAPLAKGGVMTITGDRTTAESVTFGDDDVFNFFSLGVRLGHFRYPKLRHPCAQFANDDDCDNEADYAPELVSWLDITTGRWENFEVVIPTGQLDNAGNAITVRQRRWRYQAEGRLKVPETPFLIGFDGNFGQGPDDLRFAFGMRFDVGKLINRLKIQSLLEEQQK